MRIYFCLNRHLTILTLLIFISFFGCATTQDVSFTNKKIIEESGRVDQLEKVVNESKVKASDLDKELHALKKDMADIKIHMQHTDEHLLTMEARIEEYKDLIERSIKSNSRQMEGLLMRIERIEEITKGLSKEVNTLKDAQKDGPLSLPLYKQQDLDEETLYNIAYDTFKKGDFDNAREIFTDFIERFPKGKFSDNARFWIGDCYYRTNQYEKAILEYEKVKQEYPSGDKVPSALFKQALSFLKLNKKDEAKIILKNLIDHYPDSDQAVMAKDQLNKLSTD